ncbi:MAG TPA: copper homeostasis protein CutC [Ferruginibacter sp.]|nr:copper homeostasis protein CutC [Ferruginibacter sp.]
MTPYKLEIIGFNIESCVLAQSAGAHRVELCDNPGEGGTTPSHGFIKAAREKLQIDLYPIIRPRGGDFFYSDDEFEMMKIDVQVCKELKCNGVVIGILKKDGTVDVERCKELVQLASPMGVTFHRAFDRVADPFQALEDIISIGCERILTSGLQPTAMEGIDLIAKLIEKANKRILIMPGSGVRAGNIAAIAERSGAKEFHSSARINIDSQMEYINPMMKEHLNVVSVDAEEIKNTVNELNKFFG